MTTKYKRLFSISVMHDYFKNGVIKDIAIRPDALTKNLLRNGKMLFKTLGDNAIVLFKVDIDNIAPFIDLGKDVNFRFYVSAERSDEFFNITKLDTTETYEAGNKLYFTNDPANASIDSTNPEILTHTLIDKSFAKLFTYSFSLTSNHTKTKFKMTDHEGNLVSVGKDIDGNDLPTTLSLARDDSKLFSRQVDLRNKASGIYTITIRNDADDTTLKEETVLIDDDAVQQGVLGILDIKYTSATDHIYGETFEFYKLKFNRKMAFWKYLIVNKSKSIDLADAATSLSIEDSLTGGGPPYTNVSFDLEGNEPNLEIKVKGFDTVVFKSDAEIPSFEEPKLNVKLMLNPANKVVVEHLSNPPVNTVEKDNNGDLEKEIFVFI